MYDLHGVKGRQGSGVMKDIECGMSFQTFEHVTGSIDGQQCGNLDMWSVVWEYTSSIL